MDTLTTSRAIDFVNALQCLYGFVHIPDQKSGLAVLDDFAAGAQVHGDHGNAGRIRFCKHQPKSLRDRVQVKQRPGLSE